MPVDQRRNGIHVNRVRRDRVPKVTVWHASAHRFLYFAPSKGSWTGE